MDETLIIAVLSFAGGVIVTVVATNRMWRNVYKRALSDAYNIGYASGYKRASAATLAKSVGVGDGS